MICRPQCNQDEYRLTSWQYEQCVIEEKVSVVDNDPYGIRPWGGAWQTNHEIHNQQKLECNGYL